MNINCFVKDPVTGEWYTRDPRGIARKAEAYLKESGVARHLLLGTRAGVLPLRLDPLRPEPARGLLLHRRSRGCLEHRHGGRGRQQGIQAPLQGGLFPRPADGPLPGHPHRDDAQAHRGRCERRDPAPRGRNGRSGRDRHGLRLPLAAGRPRDAAQVRREERGLARGKTATFMPKPIFRTTARVCTSTSRSGRTART